MRNRQNRQASSRSNNSQTVSYCPCVICYSHQDERFARALSNDLRKRGVKCRPACDNQRISDFLYRMMDQTILRRVKLLVVLSQHSIDSNWLEARVERALQDESQTGQILVLPIYVDASAMNTTQIWVANLRRMHHFGDFTDPEAYQKEFEGLLQSLKKEAYVLPVADELPGSARRKARRRLFAWQITWRVLLILLIVGAASALFAMRNVHMKLASAPTKQNTPRLTIFASPVASITPPPGQSGPSSIGKFTEFGVPTAASGLTTITAGPDGNLWFTESSGNRIGRITPTGHITEFALPTANSGPWGITAGPDGNLWFTEYDAYQIGRITPTGHITEFALPTYCNPEGITVGPDGNLWFTEWYNNQIGRITLTGSITEFVLPSSNGPDDPVGSPDEITAGRDGNLWFTQETGQIGRITPTGQITEFDTPTIESFPQGITAGPDGNLWFTEVNGHRVGYITSKGTLHEFQANYPEQITVGPDHNLWFTEYGANLIGRIVPPDTLTDFLLPTSFITPDELATGPDGNLWFIDGGNNVIGRIMLEK